MALTIYEYKKELFHKGFAFKIFFAFDDESDLKIVKAIITNEFASNCIGVDIEFPISMEPNENMWVFSGTYEQGAENPITIEINKINLKIT